MSDIKTLALYLGCKCRCDRTPTLESIIISVNTNGYAKVHHSNGVSDRFYFSEIKPILRPLEVMTPEETKAMVQLDNDDVIVDAVSELEFDTHGINYSFIYTDGDGEQQEGAGYIRFNQLNAHQFAKLLEWGFDLGLLSEGEYILETK